MVETEAADQGASECERLKRKPVIWSRSAGSKRTYYANVEEEQFRLERGFLEYPLDYPLVGRFQLYRGDEFLDSFDEWPKEWRLDGWLGTLIHRMLWSTIN